MAFKPYLVAQASGSGIAIGFTHDPAQRGYLDGLDLLLANVPSPNGVALSPDERRLTLAFQSPLAHPDAEAHAAACHVRIMEVDAETAELLGQWADPLEPPLKPRRLLEAVAAQLVAGRHLPGDGEDEVAARITTRVECAKYFPQRDDALRAHATQIDPNSFFFAAPMDSISICVRPRRRRTSAATTAFTEQGGAGWSAERPSARKASISACISLAATRMRSTAPRARGSSSARASSVSAAPAMMAAGVRSSPLAGSTGSASPTAPRSRMNTPRGERLVTRILEPPPTTCHGIRSRCSQRNRCDKGSYGLCQCYWL